MANGPQEQTHPQPAAQQQQHRRIDTPHLSEPERVLIQVQLEAGRELPGLLRSKIYEDRALELEFEGARALAHPVFMLFFNRSSGRVTIGQYDGNPAFALEPEWYRVAECHVNEIVACLVQQVRGRRSAR